MTDPKRLTESEMQREIDRKMSLPGMVKVIANYTPRPEPPSRES